MLGPVLEGGSNNEADGAIAASGMIYVAPINAPQVVCFDPEARAAVMFGPAPQMCFHFRRANS